VAGLITGGTVAGGNTTITGTQSVSGLSSFNGGLSTSTIVATTANGVDTQGIVVKSVRRQTPV
jgi:hypothetical protein